MLAIPSHELIPDFNGSDRLAIIADHIPDRVGEAELFDRVIYHDVTHPRQVTNVVLQFVDRDVEGCSLFEQARQLLLLALKNTPQALQLSTNCCLFAHVSAQSNPPC